MNKQPTLEQIKLKQIDKLSNIIQKLKTKEQKDEVAYLIHQIIDAEKMTAELYDNIAVWSIEANSHLFIKI